MDGPPPDRWNVDEEWGVGWCLCVCEERCAEQVYRNEQGIGGGESSGVGGYNKELRSASGECLDGVFMCVGVWGGWSDRRCHGKIPLGV